MRKDEGGYLFIRYLLFRGRGRFFEQRDFYLCRENGLNVCVIDWFRGRDRGFCLYGKKEVGIGLNPIGARV